MHTTPEKRIVAHLTFLIHNLLLMKFADIVREAPPYVDKEHTWKLVKQELIRKLIKGD